MPLIPAQFRPARAIRNPHFQTIYPSLFRKVEELIFDWERVDTPDGDFIDLNWSRIGSNRLAIILHGLEGNADRGYAKGMALAFNRRGWDAMGLNFRGCSGEPNLLARAYHSGDTDDLDLVIRKVVASDVYQDIGIVGYSLGGNVTLKYFGERAGSLPKSLKVGAAISVPCDLAGASRHLEKGFNKVYTQYFLRKLRRKMLSKEHLIPHAKDAQKLKTIWAFDDDFTAPIHGFDDAADYYQRSHSKQYLAGISRPTLLITAEDDPFLSKSCLPYDEARASKSFYFQPTAYGGHVGFYEGSLSGEFWHERQVTAFFEEHFS